MKASIEREHPLGLRKISTEQFDLSTKSVDGLLYFNNSLLALQNSIQPMRATQYFLSDDKLYLTGYKIIDRAHPAYPEPTIGCLVGTTYYYVANSAWGSYNEQHQLVSADKLRSPVILRCDLSKLK